MSSWRPSAKIRYASSFISATEPSRRIAITPLRMLSTMCRKNRSWGIDGCRAATVPALGGAERLGDAGARLGMYGIVGGRPPAPEGAKRMPHGQRRLARKDTCIQAFTGGRDRTIITKV